MALPNNGGVAVLHYAAGMPHPVVPSPYAGVHPGSYRATELTYLPLIL